MNYDLPLHFHYRDKPGGFGSDSIFMAPGAGARSDKEQIRDGGQQAGEKSNETFKSEKEMSVSRERTIVADICDVLEADGIHPPDQQELAKKIYHDVVSKALRDAMRYGVHLCETDGLRITMQSQAFDSYMKQKV